MTQNNHSQQFCSARERLSGELHTFDLGSSKLGILDYAKQKFKVLARPCENFQVVDPKTAGTLSEQLDMVVLSDQNLHHENKDVLFGYDRIEPDMILGLEEGNPSILVKSKGKFGALLPSVVLSIEKVTLRDQQAAKRFDLPIVIVYPAV